MMTRMTRGEGWLPRRICHMASVVFHWRSCDRLRSTDSSWQTHVMSYWQSMSSLWLLCHHLFLLVSILWFGCFEFCLCITDRHMVVVNMLWLDTQPLKMSNALHRHKCLASSAFHLNRWESSLHSQWIIQSISCHILPYIAILSHIKPYIHHTVNESNHPDCSWQSLFRPG